jgi:hypothetical protein
MTAATKLSNTVCCNSTIIYATLNQTLTGHGFDSSFTRDESYWYFNETDELAYIIVCVNVSTHFRMQQYTIEKKFIQILFE